MVQITNRPGRAEPAAIRSCDGCGAARFCALRRFGLREAEGRAAQQPPVPANTVLFRQGDPIHSLLFVRAGAVKTTRVAPDGTEQVTGFYLAGDLFGLDSLATGEHAETATSLATTSVCALGLGDLDTAGITPSAVAAMCSETIEDRGRLIARLARTADQRVAALLLDLGERFAQRGLSATNFDLPMPRTDIASYLNLSHETVSRVFSRLADAGLVAASRRQIEIMDAQGLHALAESDCGSAVSKAA